MLRSRHKENGHDLLVCVDCFFSQKTSRQEYKSGLGGVVKQAEALPPPVPVALILTPSAA
jgi:hypothetical protein